MPKATDFVPDNAENTSRVRNLVTRKLVAMSYHVNCFY